jgi:hypothetical protein
MHSYGQNNEPRVFFGDRIFEQKIFEQNYSKALFCEKCSKRKMLDTETFSMTVKNEIFSMLPLAGVQGAAAP